MQKAVAVTADEHPHMITGTVAGSGSHVTGAEAGSSGRVTGTEYLPRGKAEEEARRSSAGMKVGRSRTSRGGVVSGTPLGRSFLVTGNEPGSCKMVTGNEYVGGEQYTELCAKPAPRRRAPAAASSTARGRTVTGSLPGRSPRVTGDEPGSCEAVTGTPYVGKDQTEVFCDEGAQAASTSRARPMRSTPGPELTGQQPGLNGHVTGAERGACEAVTGTPYVGKGQYESTCGPEAPELAGDGAHSDGHSAPWTAFSIMSPAREASLRNGTGEDGPRGQITGPFGKGHGKVTGTEAFKNGGAATASSGNTGTHAPAAPATVQRNKRITGEGIDSGLRITGDDWDRGDRVTGTEGSSSTVRNPTRRGGPMAAMSRPPAGRHPDPAAPESRVTGGAGASARGALVTVSGGARG